MKILEISFKNIFSYGDELKTLDYRTDNGKLVLLKGISGSGKSAILNLPVLLLYGKPQGTNKSSIANRINKNGYVKGVVENNGHVYTIERYFTPNDLKIYKDGENVENFGINSGQDYIDKEICDMPDATFSNIVSVSMDKFKSFLKMSPADRKKIIDRAFNLEVVNVVFDNIKADMKAIGSNINASNASLFSLNTTITNANNEIARIQTKMKNSDNQQKIDANLKVIAENNAKLEKIKTLYENVNNESNELLTQVNTLKSEEMKLNYDLNNVQNKINLFAQDKCPTCGTSFHSAEFENIKKQLDNLKNDYLQKKTDVQTKVNEFNAKQQEKRDYLTKIATASNTLTSEVTRLTNDNYLLNEEMKQSQEYQSVLNIINKTNEQIEIEKTKLNEYNDKLTDLTNLSVVYSLDGVKQLVINNYLPLLNKEIAENLEHVNFPYQLEFDTKFEPILKDMGMTIAPDTLSFGEGSRVDTVILCSMYKMMKRKYPSLNIFFVDEVVSNLDPDTSALVLKVLKNFTIENKLYTIIVSHTDLCLDDFDEIVSVHKENFSNFEIFVPNA